MYNLAVIIAATSKSSSTTSSGGSAITFYLFIFLIIGFGYYMLAIRPRRMASKDQQKIAQFAVGDRIITTAGIVGVIKDITDSRVFIEVADGVVLEMHKQALFHKVDTEEQNHLPPDTTDLVENNESEPDTD